MKNLKHLLKEVILGFRDNSFCLNFSKKLLKLEQVINNHALILPDSMPEIVEEIACTFDEGTNFFKLKRDLYIVSILAGNIVDLQIQEEIINITSELSAMTDVMAEDYCNNLNYLIEMGHLRTLHALAKEITETVKVLNLEESHRREIVYKFNLLQATILTSDFTRLQNDIESSIDLMSRHLLNHDSPKVNEIIQLTIELRNCAEGIFSELTHTEADSESFFRERLLG